jgi:hypothetical protein
MYNSSIAVDFRIYSIIIPSTPTLVYNLLTGAQKEDYDKIMCEDGLRTNKQVAGHPRDTYLRNPVDGYIISYANGFEVSSDGQFAWETAFQNVEYTVPVWHWPKKTYVKSTVGSVSAIIRIFLS